MSILNLLLSAVVLWCLTVSCGKKDAVPKSGVHINGINRNFGTGFAKVLKKSTPIDDFLSK